MSEITIETATVDAGRCGSLDPRLNSIQDLFSVLVWQTRSFNLDIDLSHVLDLQIVLDDAHMKENGVLSIRYS